MRFLRRSLVGLFLLALTIGGLSLAGDILYQALQTRWAQDAKVQPARERVFAVNAITAEARDIVPELTSYGEIRSRRTLDLRATSSGAVVALADAFEEGGTVTAGQLLVQIDPQTAQAALDVAQADIQETEAEGRDAARALVLARDELVAAEDQVKLRQQALDRQRNLVSRGVGTDAAVETAQLAVSSAEQAVLAKRQSLAAASARVDSAATTLARRQISLADAKRALANTKIYAEFDGTLADVAVVQGGLVSNNEQLAKIVDASALEVSFRLSTAQYARLLDASGQLMRAPISVSLDIYGVDLTSNGTITRESAAVGEGQTGRLLFAGLDQAKGFRPGDFVTVRISEPLLEQVVTLPATAVDAASTVLVINADDRLESLPVTVLRRQGDVVIARAPMLAGRRLVSERTPLLGQGIKVRVSEPNTGAETAAAEEMLELTDERRAKLVAFVEANDRMPAEAKARVLAQLKEPKVPLQVVERLESRMGG